MIVSFIGSHYGLDDAGKKKLEELIKYTINHGANTFYCGTYGNFDKQVVKILYEMKGQYNDIRLICVKPYYKSNIFQSRKAKKLFEREVGLLKHDYGDNQEEYDFHFERAERDFFESECYADWYSYEKKYFDETMILDLDGVPYKARIVECNRWKVRQSDFLIVYCPSKYGNVVKIRDYALKQKCKILEI